MLRTTACLLALLCFTLTPALAQDGQPAGAESPQALMTALGKALATGKVENVLPLIDGTSEPAETCKLMAKTLVNANRFQSLVEKARKAHGDAVADDLKGKGGFLGMMKMPTDKLAKFGKLVGEKDADGRQRFKFEEKQADGAEFSQSLKLREVDGRWFLDPSTKSDGPGGAERAKKMIGMLKAMMPASDEMLATLEKQLAGGGDAEAFKAAAEAAAEKFRAKVQEAMMKMAAPPGPPGPPGPDGPDAPPGGPR